MCVLLLPSTALKDRCSGVSVTAREWVPGKEIAQGNRACWIITSYKLQSPMLCPETESNKLCKIKKLGLFKATPGILSVSLKGGLPIKFWTSPRAATGRTRAGQAGRCHPGGGTSPVLWAISSFTARPFPLGISSLHSRQHLRN